MNNILKELQNLLISNLYDHPLIIKELVYVLQVNPYIDPGYKNKDLVKPEWEKAISNCVKLPVTPRIGEYVEIPFVKTSSGFSSEDKYYSGYVHDVQHIIKGTNQEILITIYPFKSFYY